VIAKVVKKGSQQDLSKPDKDLEYWLSRPPEERIAAVELLRKQHYGSSHKLEKVVKKRKLK